MAPVKQMMPKVRLRFVRNLLPMALPALAAVGFVGTAHAQTTYAAPPPYYAPAPVNWGGPYLGIEGGGGWGSSHHSDDTGFDSGSFSLGGGLVGGTAGYNWQVGPVVLGVEGDMSWADISGATGGLPGNVCGGAQPHCSTKLNDLGTARARIGYGFGTILPYATAGLAFGDVHGHEGDIPANGGAGFGGAYRVGWALGAGIEDAFTPNWSVKLEYLHVDLGRGNTFTDTFADGSTAAQNVNFQADIFRIGVNYKF